MIAGATMGACEAVGKYAASYESLKLPMNVGRDFFILLFTFFYPSLVILFDDLEENCFLWPARFVNR